MCWGIRCEMATNGGTEEEYFLGVYVCVWGGYSWWECIHSSMDWDVLLSLFPGTLIHSCHPLIPKGDMQVSCTVFYVVDVVVAVPEIANNIPSPMNTCSQKTESMKKPLFSPLIHLKNIYIRNVFFCLFVFYVCWNRDWWFHGLDFWTNFNILTVDLASFEKLNHTDDMVFLSLILSCSRAIW